MSRPRIFKVQPSLNDKLTATDKSFQVVSDIAMLQVILLISYIVVRDTFVTGRNLLDLSTLYSGFGTPKTIFKALVIELCLLGLAILVQPCFQCWRYMRCALHKAKVQLDVLFVTLYLGYVLGSALGVCWAIYHVPLPTYSSAILTIEQIRLSMKTYSYVRENVYKVVYPWNKDDLSGPAVWYLGQLLPSVGSFKNYMFFMFSPTLLYRDSYARNEGPINWTKVAMYFIQFVLSIWCVSIMCREFIFPNSMKLEVLVLSYLASLICVLPIIVLGHTCVLHSYLNIFCELFKFADREFYGDWWTSNSFSTFYRKWNMLVHDWIYSYVYKDLKYVTGNQLLAVFATLNLSAFIHEYIIAVALRFAFPLLFIEFAIGGVFVYFVQPKSMDRLSNLLLLIAFAFGSANLLFLYQVEFAARIYCPKQLTIWNFITPRTFECYGTYHNVTLNTLT